MKTYLFILLSIVLVASSCKSKTESPKIQGTWIMTTPMGTAQNWKIEEGGIFNITMPDQAHFKQTGKWNLEVIDSDSILEMTMDNVNADPMRWTIRQHSDSVLVLGLQRGEQDMEIKLQK